MASDIPEKMLAAQVVEFWIDGWRSTTKELEQLRVNQERHIHTSTPPTSYPAPLHKCIQTNPPHQPNPNKLPHHKNQKKKRKDRESFHTPHRINPIPTPFPPLAPHDLLIKVAAASLCHTDHMVLAGSFPSTPLPLTASHEGSGTIVQLGSSIHDFKIGDRILCSLTYHRCGTCVDCRGAEPQYCPSAEYLGVSRDGSFAEYEVVDGREACLLPANLSFRSAAPLACAGLTAWGGLVKADLKPGQSVAMVGAGGGLGHLGVQFAKALGLYVIAIDAREEGLQLAQQCGADVVVDARRGKEKVVEEVQKVTVKLGAEATLNFSDHETAAPTAAAVTRNHGVMVQIAQPENVSVPFMELVFRDIKIRGSLTGSRLECQRMLETVSKHEIKVQTNAFVGIEEVPKAIELAQSGRMKGKPVILIDLEAIEKEKSSGYEMI